MCPNQPFAVAPRIASAALEADIDSGQRFVSSYPRTVIGGMDPLDPVSRSTGNNRGASKPDQAVKFAYREILTREPSADEMANAMDILQGAKTATDGMADLRWVLLNSNEFRFLP